MSTVPKVRKLFYHSNTRYFVFFLKALYFYQGKNPCREMTDCMLVKQRKFTLQRPPLLNSPNIPHSDKIYPRISLIIIAVPFSISTNSQAKVPVFKSFCLKQGCGSGTAWICINLSCPDPGVKVIFYHLTKWSLDIFCSLKEKIAFENDKL